MTHTTDTQLDPSFALTTRQIDRTASRDTISLIGYAALGNTLTATDLDTGDLIVTAHAEYWSTALPELFAALLRIDPEAAQLVGDEIDRQCGDHQAEQLRRIRRSR